LRQLEEKCGKRDDITPEVLSAAYARISRDPKPINEIRQDARGEVEKSRKSNSTIIFKMGHHSVAEHAVFNLDILGLSRFAMEELEKFRLCSYTEKSQRYITLDKDFVVPEEIVGTNLECVFIDMIREQNKVYFSFYEKLKAHVFQKHADLAADPKKHNLLEGWAKEDARYITSLSTESQVGLTANARNLELMLRRFASHPLSEINQLGKQIYKKISQIAPSIVIFNEANARDIKTYPDLKGFADRILDGKALNKANEKFSAVDLVGYTADGDNVVAASLLHTSSGLPYEECFSLAQKLSDKERKDIFKTSWKNMQLYDSMLREFEYVNFTYNLVLSSACFGQLKRHRMSTLTAQDYDPDLGVTIPDSIKEVGLEQEFMNIVEKTNDVYFELKKKAPLAAPYILTNSHRKRVLMRLNARELYHVSRLREDAHAQWDIQNLSRGMSIEAKKVMPLVCDFLGGKDRFKQIYQNIYGDLPKVVEALLPAARKIK